MGNPSAHTEGPFVSPFAGDFAADPGFDFDVRLAVGHAAHGGADPGEVLSAVRTVPAGDTSGWFDAWRTLGERVLAAADDADAAGHIQTAAARYLRAANYLGFAVSSAAALPDVDPLVTTFHAHRRAWTSFVARCGHPTRSVSVPHGTVPLPGVLFLPSGAGPHRTVVLNNGSDEAISRLWTDLARPALARDWAVFVFDGPGQQSQLFEHGVPFRPDWEQVLHPVVDVLSAREDVDASRLAVWGVSQAGYWVPRALTAEHRFAAAAVDPGVVDVSASWIAHLPSELVALLDRGETAAFDAALREGVDPDSAEAAMMRFRSRPYGVGESFGEAFRAVRAYRLTSDDAARIRTPLLIADPDGEQFWPGQSRALAAMTSGVATLAHFPASEGAGLHCEPLARLRVAEAVLDWFDDTVG
ncbi:prolyl oligopeptidase family serine peptidase [Microbacterium sp. SSW1-59]|uniref:alpha/beta hydrolase family protein n=1 Tax=Microbacterium xanthum TaxID=3079794 RepID=UPI002AD54A64|nr:prolyl oligopeptidase family serine peptidase [Microbacterium sp. SSW1-59]MDZ8199897.1 prolyl oligopeptidase family serine peptidase [Microbacterium sp. SSW1-59]